MSSEVDKSVLGENDRWILFDRLTADGYPLVVFARTENALVDSRLKNGMITVVRCEADLDLVNDQGMPQHSDRIYPVEDGIARELEALALDVFHVANITGDGVRRLVYAHKTSLDLDPILGLFSPEGYQLSASPSEDRQEIIDLVVPSPLDLQLNGDLGVISNLEKNGDDGGTARKTDFWFYGEPQRLTGLAEELAAWGYGVDHWLDDPQGVVLSKEMTVDFPAFREATPILVGAAERHGVTYDGWETFVVATQPENEPSVDQHQKPSLLRKLFGPKKN